MTHRGLRPLWVRRHASRPAGSTGGEQSSAVESAVAAAVLAPAGDRVASIHAMDWGQLKSSASPCTACVLHKARKQAVLGVGDEKAEWLFVGQGPGTQEDHPA